MKKILIISLAAVGTIPTAAVDAQDIKNFNVIYIIADDLGYGDLGCYGQKKIQTPNIDRLAKGGLLFTQHYSGCTVSAPSRSVLMTGQHTGHTPIRGNKGGADGQEGQEPMPADTYTLAEMFKDAGYTTGAFGKWGLGYPSSEGDPTFQGFDEFYGYNCQVQAHRYYPTHLWHNRNKVILEGNDGKNKAQYSQDLIHAQAINFITNNSERKFFAFLPYVLPHAEILAPQDSLLDKYRGTFPEKSFVGDAGSDYGPDMEVQKYCSQPEGHAQFAAMVSRLDKYVGDVMSLVEKLGIAEKTIIIFTSDNGPHKEGGADPDFFKSYGPLRGIKRDMYEGGIRVPMIISSPSIIKHGTKTDHICAFWDFMPTFAQMTGIKVKSKINGISILPTILGQKGQKEHKYLYWEFHEQGGKIAVRMGNWKGIKLNVIKDPNAKIELYDLSKDIHEDNNVAKKYPLVLKQIEKIMNEARVPSKVFNFTEDNI